MKRCALLLVLISLATSFALAQAPAAPTASLGEPALSPDGSELAFVQGGDIWTVPAAGGDARLLVAHPATESRPLYSPDGRSLAFVSTRTGNGDLYLLDFASGETRRLTFDDANDALDAWSRDGKWLYFTSSTRDVGGMTDIYRVSVDGGTPMPVTADRYTAEYFAAPSPDGKSLAFAARGIAGAQWWRHGHSHIDETQIWQIAADGSYTALTKDGAKEIWPMWSRDGRTLYYMSDRSGSENLWSLAPGGEPRQLTTFTNGRLLWPTIAYDGKSIAFERDFAVWTLDLASGRAAQVAIRLRGAPAGPGIEHRRITDHLGDLALSPDGKKLVFSARGDLFAASTKEGGDAARITDTAADEGQPAWAPDNHTVVYVSDRDGRPHLYQYDFAGERETQLTSGSGSDEGPRYSPDGKMIAFQRNGTAVMVYDVAAKAVRQLAAALLDREPFGSERAYDWSPDSRWLAYLDYRGGLFRNAMIVPAAGGEARPASFLANGNADTLSWSRDGRYLLMSTGQRSENGQLARIDLLPTTPKFREDQFRDLFHEEKSPDTPAVKKPDEKAPASDKKPDATAAAAPKGDDAAAAKKSAKTEIDFNGIRERVTLLPVGIDVSSQIISPDGKWVALAATAAGQENLYVYSLDELSDEPSIAKQLTSSSGSKRRVQFSSDSKELYYLDQGRIQTVSVESAHPHPVAVAAEMDVDFAREKGEAFAQAWRYMHDNFFDAKMHGVDWDAVHAQYAPRVAAARTGDEFRRLLQLMVGELNASHLGARGPTDAIRITTGRLGLRFEPSEFETNGRLKVSEVITLSPADVAKIRAGESIVAVDGKSIGRQTNLDQLLEYHIGKRTTVTVEGDGGARRDVVLQPVNGSTERTLIYRKWVNDNRDYVARLSKGRLGYVHLFDMGSDSLDQLLLDLDVENRRDGVIVDVRNNNGGFVNAYALDVFSRLPYLQMTQRGFPTAPARSALGQRALERPTVLLVNRHSLSDAEDFTEGYRAMRLGKVVGEPTAGWIIFTGNVPLIDGTTFRIPSTRITDAQGKDLELVPRPVDTLVIRPIGEATHGRDSQLDAAVKELLQQIDMR